MEQLTYTPDRIFLTSRAKKNPEPATTVLMPFYAGATGLPACMQTSDLLKFDRESMWMAFNYVANYAMLKYSYMIEDIRKVQNRFESDAFGKQKALESKAQALWEAGDRQGARKHLTQYAEENTSAVLKQW